MFVESSLFKIQEMLKKRGLINLDTGKDTRGGGLVAFAHKSLRTKILHETKNINTKQIEYLIFQIENTNLNVKLLLAVLYRPPPPSGDEADETFDKIASYRDEFTNVIVCGDLNYHLEKNDESRRRLLLLVKNINLVVLPTGPSFYLPQVPSWLDLIAIDT